MVQRLLDESNQADAQKLSVKACLVPHAGYIYSGKVAAAVFSRIRIPQQVVLIGVRHSPPGEDLAILSNGAWRTPLGDVSLDASLAKQLRASCPYLQEDEVAHLREHSLEVEVPFLQVLRPGFLLTPIAIGTLDFELLEKLGVVLAEVIQQSAGEILMVASSDLNHYENEEITQRKDRRAVEAMTRMDPRGLYDVCRREAISMCGLGPMVAVLIALRKLGASTATVIEHATSGDVNGDRDAVVGYAGMTFN